MSGITLVRLGTELGFMVVFCGFAFYLLYKYFDKKIDNESSASEKICELMQDTINNQKEANERQTEAILSTQSEIKKALAELTNSYKTQNSTLQGIKDALEPASITMLNNVADVYFDLAKANISRLVVQIKEENNLDNREATAKKIMERVRIIHEERNDALTCFPFRGRRFSDFTKNEWIQRIAKLVESEVYATALDKRTWANIDNAYKAIKLEFLKCAMG